MSVRVLQSDAQWPAELEAASSRLLVADFFATWCGPCRTIAPFVEQLAARYPSVVFIKVDVDKCPGAAQSAGVTAMPTFVFYVARAKVDTVRGADQAAIESKVAEWAAKIDGGAGGTDHPTCPVDGQIDLTGFITKESVECLNESDSFTLKNMLEGICNLKSDCDEQLLISLPLRQPVRLHSIAIAGGERVDCAPRTVKIFCNMSRMLDFDTADNAVPLQSIEFEKQQVENGEVVNLRYVKFQNVQSIILFVSDNQGGEEVSEIASIKLYGTPVQATNMGDFKRVAGKAGEVGH